MGTPSSSELYGIGIGITSTSQFNPVVQNRAPTTADVRDSLGTYVLGKRWIDKSTNNSYALTSFTTSAGLMQATWTPEGGTSSGVQQLNANTGSATPTAGVITIAGTTPINTVASGSTVTVSIVGASAVTSWTPVLSFGGGTTGITYDVQSGYYFQIGPVVFFTVFINLSSKGSSTGVAAITTPVAGGVAFTQYVGSIDFWQLLTLNANFSEPMWQFNSTSFLLYEAGSGQTMTQLQDTNFDNDTTIKITGYYMTN